MDNKLSGGFNNTACATVPYNKTQKCFNIDASNDTFYEGNLPTFPWLGFARYISLN